MGAGEKTETQTTRRHGKGCTPQLTERTLVGGPLVGKGLGSRSPTFPVMMSVALALSACSKKTEVKNEAPPSASGGSSANEKGPKPADPSPANEKDPAPKEQAADEFSTAKGPLRITPVHHATLVLSWNGQTIWIDPFAEGDLGEPPKADYIFITDMHPDHLDPKAVETVSQPATVVVGPQVVKDEIEATQVMNNGETKQFAGFSVEAVPMYNLVRGPDTGQVFHEKGRGNGYVFSFGDEKVYVAGDTECTEEMRGQKNIDIAFVPMNLPYTMPPDEAAECVKEFKPKVVYPYHYRGSDPEEFAALLKDTGIEVRLRDFYR